MPATQQLTTLMDFYNPVNKSLYITDIFDWYRLPKNEHDTVLVVSVSSSAATYWVIAYTILVGLTFTAACELATLAILSYFPVGDSGNRNAILVAYYNSGSPSRTIPLMLGYFKTALFKCRRAGRWAVDWAALSGSSLLFLLTFFLFSGDTVTKFFLGGAGLMQGNVAQVNPAAIFYPYFNATDDSGQNTLDRSIFEALKGPRSPAVHQAIARRTSAGKKLKSRINYAGEIVNYPNGDTGANFSYQYYLTGYELGLRDAPGLLLGFEGSCATAHGANVSESGFWNFTNIYTKEEFELYYFFGDPNYSYAVIPGRENFTANWASLDVKYDDITFAENIEYGGWTFQIIPHTSHRVSFTEKFQDPWYETEPNPGWDPELHVENEFNGPFRVKGLRPPLRCTQNDTYSYNGHTVNHVTKLDQLPGLKLSPLIKEIVFQIEFGGPVFSSILGYVPFGSLVSTSHYVPNERRLDATRASILEDFEGLVEIAFAYSREVVRNMVLLFPAQEGVKDSVLMNAATNGTDDISNENADFLLESPDVAALSIIILLATPSVCAFMWLLVFIWNKVYNPSSRLDNSSSKGRHALRYHALQAAHLYRYLDEEVSGGLKWSGRRSNTPYIRDLDSSTPEVVEAPYPGSVKYPVNGEITERTADRLSGYVKPKLLPTNDVEESIDPIGRMASWIKKKLFREDVQVGQQYEVSMTRAWNPSISGVPWRNIRRNL